MPAHLSFGEDSGRCNYSKVCHELGLNIILLPFRKEYILYFCICLFYYSLQIKTYNDQPFSVMTIQS